MRINRTDVDHVAKLARLTIEDAELDLFTEQMGAILSYVETLNALDTDQCTPTAHAVPMANAFRDDESLPSLGLEPALANAPHRTGSYFMVPAVIE